MDPTAIIVAVIGAGATIAAAFIGNARGREKGRKEGRAESEKHSVERYLDVQEDHYTRALKAINRPEELYAIAKAVVDNAHTWRGIQENLAPLLNGLINELAAAVASRDTAAIANMLRALNEAFRGKKLAVETELKKSRI